MGTTIGAGIFVTTAVIAAVSFVADVRLARRSFVRDILFFIGTVVYLLYTTLDGEITLAEAIGFIVIYVLFVIAVAAPRLFKFVRSAEEDGHGMSVAGSLGDEGGPSAIAQQLQAAHQGGGGGAPGSGRDITKLAREPSRLIADVSHLGGGSAVPVGFQSSSSAAASSAGASPLDGARRSAMLSSVDRDIEALRRAKYFAPEVGDLGADLHYIAEDEDNDDGDLGGGSGDASTRIERSGLVSGDGTRQRFSVSGRAVVAACGTL